MASAVRRSGRQRKSNKKYLNDLREKETLRLLRESSESSRPTSPDTPDPEDVSSDDEFDTNKVDKAHISGDGEDDLSSESGRGLGVSDGSGIQTPDEGDGIMSTAATGISRREDPKAKQHRRGTKGAQRMKPDAHSRGLQPMHHNAAKEVSWGRLVGSGDQDVLALLIAREHWKWRRDATFPSRASLAETAGQGLYGNVSRFGISADDLRDEATMAWRWYDEEIGRKFRERQKLETIDGQQARNHIAFPTKHETKMLMGPTNSQQVYHLAHLSAMDFGTAWENETGPPKTPATNANASVTNDGGSDDLRPEPMTNAAGSRYREGWLLNLGGKVQCLAWAPNRHGGHTQYLASSTSCSSSQRKSVPASNDRRAPAFRPSPRYPSSIQIWAVRCEPVCEGLKRLDMAIPPKLVQVLCTHWGNIRQLQWCPVLREPRDLSGDQLEPSDSENLGLLSVLASDGHARVLDISVSTSLGTGAEYLYVNSAAFDATSPSSLFTCLSFASPTDLLCGTASGAIDLFNILGNDKEGSDRPPPTPYMTTQQSLTYMLSISPAYPSPSPNLLASLSMNGSAVLTDLLSPVADKVFGKTARFASKQLVYSPHLRSYLFSSEGDEVSAYPVRRFYNGTRVARLIGHGTVTTLATSRWHPCLLVGTTSGTVSCTNMLRRVLPSTKRCGSSGGWVQKLCEYHWIPERSAAPQPHHHTGSSAPANVDPTPSSSSSSSCRLFYGRDPRPGTSRFHDGFQAEKQGLSSMAKTRDARADPAAAGEPITETIYEEEQAVTAADWNPNIDCAGWIAVGWGSGIVRVEDVAHEAV